MSLPNATEFSLTRYVKKISAADPRGGWLSRTGGRRCWRGGETGSEIWERGPAVVAGLGQMLGAVEEEPGWKLGALGLSRRRGGRDLRPALTAAFMACTQ